MPLVDLPEGISNEQRNFVKEILCIVKDVFCKSKDKIDYAKDLKLKLNLYNETPVQMHYGVYLNHSIQSRKLI